MDSVQDEMLQSSRANRALLFGYIALLTFVWVALGGLTDIHLLSGTSAPLLGISLPLSGFYIAIPLFLLALHFSVLFNQLQHMRKLRSWSRRREKFGNAESRFFPYIFNYIEGAHAGQAEYTLLKFSRWSLFYLWPLVTHLYIMRRFAACHEMQITLFHSLTVGLDILLLLLYWHRLAVPAINRKKADTWAGIIQYHLWFTLGRPFYRFLRPLIFIQYEVARASGLGDEPDFKYFRDALKKERRLYGLYRRGSLSSRWLGPTTILVFLTLLALGRIQDIRNPNHDSFRLELMLTLVPSLDLSRHKFENGDLSLDLRGRDLRFANFRRADLAGVNMQGAQLPGADLSEANLKAANLRGADLSGAILRNAIMDRAALNQALLPGADLSNVSLFQANLNGARLDGTILRKANLSEARLKNVNLENSDLQGASFRNVDLREFSLRGQSLRFVDMSGADLSRSNLRGINIYKSNLEGANLFSANLQGAGLRSSLLTGVNLQNALLQGAKLESVTLEGAGLKNASLQGAEFNYVNLAGVDLSGVFIRGAAFYASPLASIQLQKAFKTYQGADWRNMLKLAEEFPASGSRKHEYIQRIVKAGGRMALPPPGPVESQISFLNVRRNLVCRSPELARGILRQHRLDNPEIFALLTAHINQNCPRLNLKKTISASLEPLYH